MPINIIFDQSDQKVAIKEGTNLSLELNSKNSPVLFGCRTGLCATCLVEVIEGSQELAAPDAKELEILSIYEGQGKNLRLACQLSPAHNLKLKYIGG
jgi:ferredoxin